MEESGWNNKLSYPDEAAELYNLIIIIIYFYIASYTASQNALQLKSKALNIND